MLSPILIVGLSIVLIALAIGALRLHAFVALMGAAVFVGLLSATNAAGAQRFTKAVEQAMAEFGNTAGKLGFAIALAAIIGFSLMESGAADKIVRTMIRVFGERRAAIGLLLCSFVLAAPVFVDTVFLLLLPLARAMSRRTGRDFLLYVLVIGSGAVISNGIVPPAPGPLLVAEQLKLQIGHAIVAGILFGIPVGIAGLLIAAWFNRRSPVAPVAEPIPASDAIDDGGALPGFWISVASIALPLLLIASASFAAFARNAISPGEQELVQFLGNKNVALAFGACIAVNLNLRRQKRSWRQAGQLLGQPVEAAALIILIVSAGGAYGAMINRSGVGEAIRSHAGTSAINPVLFAWAVTAVIRGALGSATVATITGVGIMSSIVGRAGFGVHPLYIFLAIGFGSKCLPWMNDAGFWVVSRISGLSQGEMLRTWSPALTLLSVVGLIEVLVVSTLWPQLHF